MVAALEQAERAQLVKGPSGRQERRWRFAHQLICHSLELGAPTAQAARDCTFASRTPWNGSTRHRAPTPPISRTICTVPDRWPTPGEPLEP